MRAFWKLQAPAATFVVAAIVGASALGAIATSSASAGEYCRQDVTAHMTGCGFDTMEQCKAASAGIGGDCFRDPKLNTTGNAFSNLSNSRNALAYQPHAAHARRGVCMATTAIRIHKRRSPGADCHRPSNREPARVIRAGNFSRFDIACEFANFCVSRLPRLSPSLRKRSEA